MPEYSPLTYSVDQDHARVSQDLTVNMQGRCLLDLCIVSRLPILNGDMKVTAVVNTRIIHQWLQCGQCSEMYMDSYSENEIQNVTKILHKFDFQW